MWGYLSRRDSLSTLSNSSSSGDSRGGALEVFVELPFDISMASLSCSSSDSPVRLGVADENVGTVNGTLVGL